MKIKNIIFDVDGVLLDLDASYINFLKEHYPEHKDISYTDLKTLFPIEAHDGAIELSRELGKHFFETPHYDNRPLLDGVMETLYSLKDKGLKFFILSAADHPQRKEKFLKETFGDIFDSMEFSSSGKSKEEGLEHIVDKYNLKKEETLFIDDRFYNIRAGINSGVNVIRKEPVNALPLPDDLSHVKTIYNLKELLGKIHLEKNSQ